MECWRCERVASLVVCTEPASTATAELGDLFGVARATVYPTIRREQHCQVTRVNNAATPSRLRRPSRGSTTSPCPTACADRKTQPS